jgi:hypothetical protein
MVEVSPSAPMRRTLLQRGLALVGGTLGVGALGGEVHARSAVAIAPPPTLLVQGRRRPSGHMPKGNPSATHHVVLSGELLDAAGEKTIGSFHTNGFCLTSVLGPSRPAASNIAFETFVFADGTLFGLGAGPSAGAERTCAVIGGTGRYAGAHGSYTERVPPARAKVKGAVEFLFALNA